MVMAMFADRLHVKVIACRCVSEQFLGHLAGVTDPEAEAQDHRPRPSSRSSLREAAKLKQAKWLAQGTIYPDVIESGGAKTKKAITIKSHHNVGGLPADARPEARSSPCASCSRTRCASSAWRSACRTTWSTAIRSRGPASAFASSAK